MENQKAKIMSFSFSELATGKLKQIAKACSKLLFAVGCLACLQHDSVSLQWICLELADQTC